MKAMVEIQDKEKGRIYTGTIEVPSRAYPIAPFELSDAAGNKLPVRVRSDLNDELQVLVDHNGRRLSAQFWALEIGKKQTIPGGVRGKERVLEIPTWKFAKTALKISVTRLE